jgi:uncharacterized protein (TIGR03067 family)
MKRIVCVLTVAICSLPGCDSRSESEKLQGEWLLEESRGLFRFYVPPTSRSNPRLTFVGDGFTCDSVSNSRYYKDDPRPSISGNYSCDRTASPKRITFVFVDTSGKKRTVNGIYEVSSGILRIGVSEDDDRAPATFDDGVAGIHSDRPALLRFTRKE